MNQMTPGRMVGKAAPARPAKKQGLEIAFDPDADPLDELAPDPFLLAGSPDMELDPLPGSAPDGDEVGEAPVRRARAAGARREGVPPPDDAPDRAGPDFDDPAGLPTGSSGPARAAAGAERDAAAGPAPRRADPVAAARALGIPVPLAKIEVTVSVEVGRTRLSLADLVSVEPGELVALDRMTSAPVDVLVNGKPFARGEIVAIGERFGVRLTELLETGDLA